MGNVLHVPCRTNKSLRAGVLPANTPILSVPTLDTTVYLRQIIQPEAGFTMTYRFYDPKITFSLPWWFSLANTWCGFHLLNPATKLLFARGILEANVSGRHPALSARFIYAFATSQGGTLFVIFAQPIIGRSSEEDGGCSMLWLVTVWEISSIYIIVVMDMALMDL